jgi:hypothetical protein
MLQDVPEEYRNLSLHIALERADTNKDWDTFKKIYATSPAFLKQHLQNTSIIFDYNYQMLPIQEQEELFK